MLRRDKAAKMMADALCEWAHMMYNVETAAGVLRFIVGYLEEHLKQFEDEIKKRRSPK